MEIFHTQGGILEPSSLLYCVNVIRNGEVICYPTETFYALGIDLWNEAALSRLYQLKQRPLEKELPLIAADSTMVSSLCDTTDSRFPVLAKAFWPGPLTLVLPSRDGNGSYAIRVSSHPVARQLAKALGQPLVSTSANRSGEPSLHSPDQLPESMKPLIAVLVDSGPTAGSLPSTIVSLLERPGKILREGAIPAAEIVSLL